MDREIDVYGIIEELLTIQARVMVLEMLYTKFVNLEEPPAEAKVIEDLVREQLRNHRRKLTTAIRDYLGMFQ